MNSITSTQTISCTQAKPAFIKTRVTYQWAFIKSGDVHDCRMMGLMDIENATHIDITTISRSTRNVLIFTSNGSYSLNSTGMDIEHPTLFDDGATRNGKSVSRLEVVSEIRVNQSE